MPDTDLHQLGVLVTRPAHQAEGLCRMIEQAGGQAIPLALIEIASPADEAAAKAALAHMADVDILIFISANAVHRCYLYIGKDLPAGPKIACVGRGTARQLQQDYHRAADLLPDGGYNSEALLAMPALQPVAGKRILILKGEGGRTLLADTLADRGADVSYANLYRRRLPADAAQQLAAIQDKKIDVVVLTSGEGIANLLALAGETSRDRLCNITWVVIHPRLVEIARQSGCRNEIIVSEGPGDEQIMLCLRQWAQRITKT